MAVESTGGPPHHPPLLLPGISFDATPTVWRRDEWEECGLAKFSREGATVCVAWDGAAEAMLVSVDGAPFVAPFPPDSPVGPSATTGAGLYPAVSGHGGGVVQWSLSGGLGLAPPSPDYAPFLALEASPPQPNPHMSSVHPPPTSSPLPPPRRRPHPF